MKTIDKVREELNDIRHYYANIKDFERVSTEIGRPSALEMVERYNRHIKNVVCPIGVDEQKLLLFDDFKCFDEGTLMGTVNKETIREMKKAN